MNSVFEVDTILTSRLTHLGTQSPRVRLGNVAEQLHIRIVLAIVMNQGAVCLRNAKADDQLRMEPRNQIARNTPGNTLFFDFTSDRPNEATEIGRTTLAPRCIRQTPGGSFTVHLNQAPGVCGVQTTDGVATKGITAGKTQDGK